MLTFDGHSDEEDVDDQEVDENVNTYGPNSKYHKFCIRKNYYYLLIISVLLLIGLIIVFHQSDSLPRSTTTLKSLCKTTVWRPNLYLDCSTRPIGFSPSLRFDAQGTINVRNSLITCLRFAIDGGMGFILPNIAIRSDKDPRIFDSMGNITLLFDDVSLVQNLNDECPELKIHYNRSEVVASIITSRAERYKRYSGIGSYRKYIDESTSIEIQQESIVFSENAPLFGWDFRKDSTAVHDSLMNIVQFNTSLQAIGNSLASKIDVDFLGFHLRAEIDWPLDAYDSHISTFLNVFNTRRQFEDIQTIYVAIGSIEIENKFREQMKALNIEVISKTSLMNSYQHILAQTTALSFDQLAVIDYQVLKQSKYFVGNGASSFSYGIAYERGNGELTKCDCHLINSDSAWVPPNTVGPFVCCY